MKKVIGGKKYVEVPELEYRKCLGCVAVTNGGVAGPLCHALENECSVNHTIWKEQTMSEKKEKTALELVDGLIGMMGCPPPGQLIKLKSAIERERDASEITIDGLEELVKSNTRTIQDMNDRLKSAITMRPIAELPDSVPDGCAIVTITSGGLWWTRGAGSPLIDDRLVNYATHFYILPLPKPARRLHPCYMPGCGGDGKCVYDYSGSEDRSRKSWFVDCLKCHAQGPRCDSEQEAEQAWGYE